MCQNIPTVVEPPCEVSESHCYAQQVLTESHSKALTGLQSQHAHQLQLLQDKNAAEVGGLQQQIQESNSDAEALQAAHAADAETLMLAHEVPLPHCFCACLAVLSLHVYFLCPLINGHVLLCTTQHANCVHWKPFQVSNVHRGNLSYKGAVGKHRSSWDPQVIHVLQSSCNLDSPEAWQHAMIIVMCIERSAP